MSGPKLVLLREDAATARRLRAIQQRNVAVAIASPSHRSRRIGRLAERVLEGLGISGDVTGCGRNDTDDWQLAHLHLANQNIRHLIVVDTHFLDGDDLQSLAELTYATCSTLWLVAWPDHLTDTHLDRLRRWPIEMVDADRFATQFLYPDVSAPEQNEPPGDLHVRVPATSFLTFRADARQLLDDDQYAAVDQRYRDVHQAADVLAQDPDLDEDTVATWLTARLESCATLDQMLTTVRAAQARLLVAGQYLQVDLDAFLGRNQNPHTAASRSTETWRRLGAYRQPYRTAACVLAASSLSLEQMRSITLADIADNHSHVTAAGQVHPIEQAAQRYIALQQLARQVDGAAPNDPFLPDNAGAACSDNQLKRAITDPATEVGVALISGQVVRRAVDPRYWTRRQGFSLQTLDPKAS